MSRDVVDMVITDLAVFRHFVQYRGVIEWLDGRGAKFHAVAAQKEALIGCFYKTLAIFPKLSPAQSCFSEQVAGTNTP
ncbi:hypothetical protein GGR28_003027 [Lewinella aquimaris]|uniref:Uncharacterized protein n=1 Tax=Neolewinella aquimaris TaxID=1835722 RepID=A0A840E8X8_9BACT|nr:hypothetical protein [Neolewinella aquimaris]MBB4080393.1 hypothetical protein [Neolewinella aquimaris]